MQAIVESHEQRPGVLLPSQSYSPTNDLNDEQALTHWLDIYHARRHDTWRSYKKEAARFRCFLAYQKDLPDDPHLLRDATELDVAMFEAVLVGKDFRGIRPGLQVLDETGKPAGPYFKAPLKRSSVNQALTVLHVMYEHWRKPDSYTLKPYVIANPVSRILRATSRRREQIDRSVPQEAISAMAEWLQMQTGRIKRGETGSAVDLTRTVRMHWLLHLLFGLWLRRAEASNLRMNSFVRTHSGWIARIDRKGRKEQTVPVPDWMMDVLFSYRVSLNMAPVPAKDDVSPAIMPIHEKGRRSIGQTLSSQTIYLEVRHLANETAKAVAAGELLQGVPAERRDLIDHQLRAFSPHWFRHTGASIAINSGAITVDNASKMLGHTSPAITSAMYFHEDREKLRDGLNQMGAALLSKTAQST